MSDYKLEKSDVGEMMVMAINARDSKMKHLAIDTNDLIQILSLAYAKIEDDE